MNAGRLIFGNLPLVPWMRFHYCGKGLFLYAVRHKILISSRNKTILYVHNVQLLISRHKIRSILLSGSTIFIPGLVQITQIQACVVRNFSQTDGYEQKQSVLKLYHQSIYITVELRNLYWNIKWVKTYLDVRLLNQHSGKTFGKVFYTDTAQEENNNSRTFARKYCLVI